MARRPRPQTLNQLAENNGSRVVKTVDVYDGALLTIQGCADAWGVSHQAVRGWIADGAPVARQRQGQAPTDAALVSIAAIHAWKRDRAVALAHPEPVDDGYDYNAERARKTAHEADLAELKARRASGDLITIDAAAEVLEAELADIRAALSNIPSRLSTDLAMISDAAEIRTRIRDEISAVLTELSSGGEMAARACDYQPADDDGD